MSSLGIIRKMKLELLNIKKEDVPYITQDDIDDICMCLSKEASNDLKVNGYKNNTINYSKLKTETLKELSHDVLIVGTGKEGTVIITGESKIMC